MKKLTIGFDINPAAMPNKTGIGYYAYYLLDNLAKYNPDINFVAYYYNLLGRKGVLDLPRHPNITYRAAFLMPGKAVNMLRRLGIEWPVEFLMKQKADAVIYASFLSQPSVFGALSVPVIHDLTFLVDPGSMSKANQRDLERFVPKTIARADIITSISDSTIKDIKARYDTSGKTFVRTHIPPAAPLDVSPKDIAETCRALNINQPYYLFIGTLEPRKNLIALVRAHRSNEYLRSRYALVLAGKADWNYADTMEEINAARRDGCEIITTGYVTDRQKAGLLAGAELYAMPSTYEGFGMPILEALSYGTPVAASDIPVFHEVAQGAAAYFDPKDPADMARVLAATLKDAAERRRITEAGAKLLRSYDWKPITAELVGAIKAKLS